MYVVSISSLPFDKKKIDIWKLEYWDWLSKQFLLEEEMVKHTDCLIFKPLSLPSYWSTLHIALCLVIWLQHMTMICFSSLIKLSWLWDTNWLLVQVNVTEIRFKAKPLALSFAVNLSRLVIYTFRHLDSNFERKQIFFI